jgi:4a-hydroxytetrahydrobiopterin dehydratase
VSSLFAHQESLKMNSKFNEQRILKLSPNECPTPTPRLLSEREVESALSHLQGWSRQGNKLHRQYHFSSFEKALGFLSGLALIAQGIGNHLESEEIYNSVNVDLSTPEVEGIADTDVELAYQADTLAISLRLPQREFNELNSSHD